MRRILEPVFGVGLVLCGLVGCEPALVNDGRFWTGRADAGVGVDSSAGSGGSTAQPPGSGGADAGPGSGGAIGSGGISGSGGGGAPPETGGTPGSGGNVGSGGLNGSGGVGATGGAVASGGSPGSGGRSASGGVPGSGGAPASGGGPGSGGATGVLTGTLKVSVTTKAAGGRYAPDNVGAIWIADSGTKFVKSLYVWGSQRRRELSTWTSATSAAGLANNLVDAVTAATMSSHGVRTGTWNGTNASRTLVPDGTYKVCFELRDGSGQSQCLDFMKGRAPQTLMPGDTTTFTKRSIGYTP